MYLHENKAEFASLIETASNILGIEEDIIEKDYYLTIFLKHLQKKIPNLLFKGGTSLSKCYHIINRFSEDIDITWKQSMPSEKQRQSFKKAICEVCDEFGLVCTNAENLWSKKRFNRYYIAYPRIANRVATSENLLIETSFFDAAYPSETKVISSFIGDLMIRNNQEEQLVNYDLEPFNIVTQSLSRTLIDKIFAICDYYLENRITNSSRHIYDIYKILNCVSIDSNLRELFDSVRVERMNSYSSWTPSASNEYNIQVLLEEIVNKSIYKRDYENTTMGLIFDDTPYEVAISGIQKLIDSHLFE